jgi:hypothetical protein
VNPDATESCNGADDDCDSATDEVGSTGGTQYYTDGDGDGYGDEDDSGDAFCSDPGTGYSSTSDDCDDSQADINPGATEICDDSETDEDCDDLTDDDDSSVDLSSATSWFEDADNDGYGDPSDLPDRQCNAPAGTTDNSDDCDDGDETIHPGAAELCDGQINDCDSSTLPGDEVDDDADGYVECTFDADGWDGTAAVTDGSDCDDEDAGVNAGATESEDSVDQDCDGLVDEDFAAVGDLILTELMLVPNGVEPTMEWFEVYNPGSSDRYADGILFASDCDGGAQFYVGQDGLVVPAGGYALLCHDETALGSSCDYIYGSDVNGTSAAGETFENSFCLTNGSNVLTISLGATELDGVSVQDGADDWPTLVTGYSIVLDPSHYDEADNDLGASWCYPATSGEQYDAVNDNHGSPGSTGTCQTAAPN